MSKKVYKQFNALEILPKKFHAESIFDLERVANWIEENKIEGEKWEFVQTAVWHRGGGGVDLLLKRK